MAIEVAKVELKNVQDASGIETCIRNGQFRADEVIAVINGRRGVGKLARRITEIGSWARL